MKNEITELKTKIAQYETDYNDLTSKLNAYTQNKIKDEMEYHNLKDENTAISNDIQRIQNIINVKTLEILELQNNKTKHKSREDNLRSENDLYKKENTNFKNVYDELAKRKAIQINALTNENDELKNEISSLKRKLKTKDETESEQIFEIAKLKQENAIMKSDIEHLTKIIDDSAFAVKTANEKEQHVDTLIKNYKQKLDDALLEKDKALIKHKHQETQLNKLTNEYTAIARDKALIYDNMLSSSKRKYDELIQAKNDEIAQIKTDILGYKMEKDKYQSDYGLLLNEYEKIKNNYHIDNNTYISKYEDIQRKSVATSKEYENNIMKLNIAIDHLETENKTFQAEINSFKQNEKLREAQFTQITKNENDLRKQLNKIKEKLFMFNKDNERLRSEIELQKDLYESKIGNVKEEYDIKIIRMENVINQQKEQLGLIEGRTYGMLKKQEKLTEKFKKEYFNTIDFYEAKIKEIQSEDVNGENTHAIVCEEDVE
jgi:chromosome segregation ATPase